MASVTDNPYLAGTDPDWLKIWKQFNPDDTTGDVAVGKSDGGLAGLTETGDVGVTRLGSFTATPPAGGVGGIVGFPDRGAPHYPAVVASGPEFIAPGAAGNPSDVTFVRPQLPDPNDSFKTHYGTGAAIYWDPSDVTGGSMGSAGTFVPTGGAVTGLGKALGLAGKALGPTMASGYDLPAGYEAAIAQGPAAAADFLQSGPRGADGLTDAQRHLVQQIVAPTTSVPGVNQFQEYLDALGASQTPTGTSVAGNKVTTPGGIGWRGGAPSTGGPQGIRGQPSGGGQRTSWADYLARRNKAKKAG